MRAIDVFLLIIVVFCIACILLAIFSTYHFTFLFLFVCVWTIGYKINNWKIKELTKRGEL